jgi:O-antigen/teichoic acid export membrane protein
MDHTNKIIKGSAIVILTNFTLMGLGYLTRLFLARNFSVEEFGLMYGVIAFINFFQLFYYLGLNNAIVKFVAEFKTKNKKYKIRQTLFTSMISQFALTLPISICIILFRKELSIYFFKSELASLMIIIGSIYLLLSPLGLIKEYFRGLQNMKLYSLFDIVQNSFTLIISILAYYFLNTKLKVNGLILSFALYYLVLFGIYISYLLKEKILSIKLFNLNLSKKMLKFGIPLVLSAVLSMFFGKIDVMLITFFKGLTEVGYYNVSIPTIGGIFGILGACGLVFFPVVSELLAKNKKKQLIVTTDRIIKYILIVGFPIMFFIIGNSKEIISILFGNKYKEAFLAMIFYSPMIILAPLNKIFAPILMSLNKTKVLAKNSMIVIFIDFIGNVLLIMPYGLVGVVSSSVIAYLILVVLNATHVKKHIKIKFPFENLSSIMFSSSLFLILSLFIKGYLNLSPIFLLLISGLMSFCIYIVLLFLLKLISLDELTDIASSFKKKNN